MEDSASSNGPEQSDEQISLPDSGVVYADSRIEAGIEDGDGYLEFTTTRDTTHRVSVTDEELRSIINTNSANRDIDIPEPPVDVERSVSSPGSWSEGVVWHTGGGIWCRRFQKELDEYTVQASYDIKYREGVELGLLDADGRWLGDLAHKDIEPDTDAEAIETARELIRLYESGEFDEEEAALLTNQ
jgi:hypothetical protein